MIYLDSSAVVKLARRETETPALRRWLADQERSRMLPVSSALVRTETTRALARSEPAALTVLPRILAVLHQFAITNDIIDVAARLPGASLRSLDALHLATAEAVRPALAWFVTYDKRLAEAASQHGFAVAAPELA